MEAARAPGQHFICQGAPHPGDPRAELPGESRGAAASGWDFAVGQAVQSFEGAKGWFHLLALGAAETNSSIVPEAKGARSPH